MKLLAYTISGQTIGIDIGVWDDAMLSGNTAFIAIADTGSTPTDYVDISSTYYWDNFGGNTTLTAAEIKQEIVKLIPDTPTPEEYLMLENYATDGLNSMTNIDDGVTFGSVLTGTTYLTGVTDNKMATSGDSTANLEVSTISGDSGTFWGDYRIEGKLWVETIRRVKQEANQLIIRVEQDSGLGGGNIAGMVILDPTGATTGATSGETPYYIVGVDKDGVLVAGWSGDTQPVARGSASMTTYSTTDTGGITTTSTSDVLMQGMEITSVPAGDYFLSFGNTFNHSSNGESILTTIYVGGVEVTNSLMGWTRGNAQGDIYTSQGYSNYPITLGTTSTIEIRWRTTSATATSTNRYLSLLKTG